MGKPISYFEDYSDEYDPAVPESILRAGDPSKQSSKDDETLTLAHSFWQEEYKGAVVTQYQESSRSLYLAQLRILIRKLHQIMQDYVLLVPQHGIVDEDFRLDDEKIAFFGEGDGESTLFANTFLGRMYEPSAIIFGDKPEYKQQRLTLLKCDLEVVVFYLQQALTPCLGFRLKHKDTPFTAHLTALLKKTGSIVVLFSNSLRACADGLLVIGDARKSLQEDKSVSKSRAQKIFLKKQTIVYDGALTYIDWAEKKISLEHWGVHISNEAVRVAQNKLKLGLISTTEKDAHADTSIMQTISQVLADDKEGVKALVAKHFNYDAIAEIAVWEIFAEIKQIITDYQGKPLAEKVHGLQDKHTPTYEQAFRKAMQSFIDAEIFTEEELIVNDETSLPTIMQPKYDHNLFIRCMPEAVKRCVAAKELVDIEEIFFHTGPKEPLSDRTVRNAIRNARLFRLQILLKHDPEILERRESWETGSFIEALNNFSESSPDRFYLDGMQHKIAIQLLLEASRKNAMKNSSDNKERKLKIKPSAIDYPARSTIRWKECTPWKGLNFLAIAAKKECCEEIFSWVLAQAQCDLGEDYMQLTVSAHDETIQPRGKHMSAWMLVLDSLNLNKILAFLTRIPALHFKDIDSMLTEGYVFLEENKDKKDDREIQIKCGKLLAIKPYLDICNHIRRNNITGIEELLSSGVKCDIEIVLQIIAKQFPDRCPGICEYLATTKCWSSVDVLLKLKQYAPVIDINVPRRNLRRPEIVYPTPLCAAIFDKNYVAIQRLMESKVDPTVYSFSSTSLILATEKVSGACFKMLLDYTMDFFGKNMKKITAFINLTSVLWGSCLTNLARYGSVAELDYLLSHIVAVSCESLYSDDNDLDLLNNCGPVKSHTGRFMESRILKSIILYKPEFGDWSFPLAYILESSSSLYQIFVMTKLILASINLHINIID